MASMKKSISLQQRQYLSNFLHNLETQGEIFHVINILWFSMKVYHRFVASTFALYFLHDVFMKAPNVLFSRCHIKISDYPSHSFIAHVWHFQWRKFKAYYLDNIYVSSSRFFYDILRFLFQKNCDINVKDIYMRLFLGQSKTIVYIYIYIFIYIYIYI